MMEVVVDRNANEDGLFDVLHGQGLSPVRGELSVGDVCLRSPSRAIFIERKTWDDLRSSISDGRKSEQQLRAMGSMSENEHFMYMIVTPKVPEWDGKPSRGIPNRNAFASLLKTQLRDGVVVHWARSTVDMGHTIEYLYRQLRDNKLLMATHTRHVDAYVQQRKRKASEENPMAQMLASVSGSSMSKAEAITAVYPTMKALVGASSDDIAKIKVGKQKIGPSFALKLNSIFHGTDG